MRPSADYFGRLLRLLLIMPLRLSGDAAVCQVHHEGSRLRSLGEQALSLGDVGDRLTALRRCTAAMQVTLARVIVLRALASIAARWDFTALPYVAVCKSVNCSFSNKVGTLIRQSDSNHFEALQSSAKRIS